MGTINRLLKGVREVIKMGNDIEHMSDAIKMLASEVREMDKRLVRVETIVDIATNKGLGRN